VVVGVQGGKHEIAREMGISPPKPNIECDMLNNGGGLLQPAETVHETCGVMYLRWLWMCEMENTRSGGG
jgi:hypothetical protein